MDPESIIDESYKILNAPENLAKMRIIDELGADAEIDHDLMADEYQVMTYEDATNLYTHKKQDKEPKATTSRDARDGYTREEKNVDTSFRDFFTTELRKPTAPPAYSEATIFDEIIKEKNYSLTDINKALSEYNKKLIMIEELGYLRVVEKEQVRHKEFEQKAESAMKCSDKGVGRKIWIFKNKIFGEYKITDVEIKGFLKKENPDYKEYEIDKIYESSFTEPKDVIEYVKNTKKYRNLDQMIQPYE